MDVLEQIPKTALDIFRLLPEGTLCEVIDNVLYMSPAPKYNHQRLVGLLFKKISDHVEMNNTGFAIVSPFDVYFEDLLSAVQPDILVILNNNRDILKDDGYVHGAPDVIIEVLSGDVKRDTVTKKALYEKAGVKEYFIVNPANRKIQGFSLQPGGYVSALDDTGRFTSALLAVDFEF